MPIVTAFDTHNHITSVESILKEFTHDYLSSVSHILIFQPPDAPTTPTVWFQLLPSRNRETRTRSSAGRTVQRKDFVYAVSMLSNNRQTTIDMTEKFGHAVLASASALAAAGLRYVSVTEFQDIPIEPQSKSFRRSGILNFTVTLTV